MTSQHEVVDSKRMEKKYRKGILSITFDERHKTFVPCFCSYRRFSTLCFFHESVSPCPWVSDSGAISNLYINLRRYSHLCVYRLCYENRREAVHRCQRHRRNIISGVVVISYKLSSVNLHVIIAAYWKFTTKVHHRWLTVVGIPKKFTKQQVQVP
jgi:hypothetical protein